MSKIELNQLSAQPVLAIRTRTTMEGLPKIIGDSYMRIMAYLNELGEQPADCPYTAYHNLDMQNLDVEMGFPVARTLPEKGEMKSGEIPSGKAASFMYKGPYAGMEQPYNEIFKWLAENGHEATGIYYEHYYNSPAEVAENDLLTKIVIPIK